MQTIIRTKKSVKKELSTEEKLEKIKFIPLNELSKDDLIFYCDFLISDNNTLNSLKNHMVEKNTELWEENSKMRDDLFKWQQTFFNSSQQWENWNKSQETTIKELLIERDKLRGN